MCIHGVKSPPTLVVHCTVQLDSFVDWTRSMVEQCRSRRLAVVFLLIAFECDNAAYVCVGWQPVWFAGIEIGEQVRWVGSCATQVVDSLVYNKVTAT